MDSVPQNHEESSPHKTPGRSAFEATSCWVEDLSQVPELLVDLHERRSGIRVLVPTNLHDVQQGLWCILWHILFIGRWTVTQRDVLARGVRVEVLECHMPADDLVHDDRKGKHVSLAMVVCPLIDFRRHPVHRSGSSSQRRPVRLGGVGNLLVDARKAKIGDLDVRLRTLVNHRFSEEDVQALQVAMDDLLAEGMKVLHG
mmetsp:Transcript_76420/g.212281  ORF Transcript_76420/g.212281 Transcript_76420/m.212281 type:complete len:200 (+) Transcript_76420:111-710(+)